jgi:DNA polymerase-3 subunit beta
VVGNTRLTTRLIEGEFPNYRGLIPASYPNRLTVGREPLLDALRRVKLMAREATPVRLVMNSDGLELIAITQDVGQANEQIDAKFEGGELTVAFNPEYLLTGVEVAPGDEVTISTVDPFKPAVLRATDGDDFLYLLMPVRVS